MNGNSLVFFSRQDLFYIIHDLKSFENIQQQSDELEIASSKTNMLDHVSLKKQRPQINCQT